MTLMRGDGTGALLAPLSFTCSGTGGAGIIAGDFNGDSYLDVATAETVNATSTFGRVSVFLNNAAGGFLTQVPYVVGAGCRSVATADFNLDGMLDLVTANSATTANSVSILTGAGLGTFTVGTDLTTGAKPWSVAAADVNNDGFPDFATADNGGNTLSIFLGNGVGFAFPMGFTAGVGPRGVALDDLNGDGYADAVVVNGNSNDVSVHVNNGTGVMALSGYFAVGTNPSSVTIGDVNGDGFADVCATDQTGAISNLESVLLGNGTATFPAPNNFPTGNFPSSSKIADMNADGRPEIVVANYGGMGVTVLLNIAAPPASFQNHGASTRGCQGNLGITLRNDPTLGNAQFGFNTTNAPRRGTGGVLVSDAADIAGSDPFFLGVNLHVDMFSATELFLLDSKVDGSGTSFIPAAIPAVPALVFKSYYAQALYVEPPGEQCSSSFFHLSATNGAGLTILP
jgi:hypothetical protein